MPRPSTPVLSRKAVVSAALRIIDADGLAACSMPRLAREFGVRTPSLYHHFDDRADLMAEVARMIVRETPVPRRRRPEDWIEWFVAVAVNFRRQVLRHPNAAPILLEFMPREILSARFDDAARFLTEVGVPTEAHVVILDGLEVLSLGAGLTQAMKNPAHRSKVFPAVHREAEPALAAAVAANRLRTAETLFAEVVRSFLIGAIRSAERAGTLTGVTS